MFKLILKMALYFKENNTNIKTYTSLKFLNNIKLVILYFIQSHCSPVYSQNFFILYAS